MSSTSTPRATATGAGLLTALVLVPLSMGVVRLTQPTNATPAPTLWQQAAQRAAELEDEIASADYRRTPLRQLLEQGTPRKLLGSQVADSALPGYRAAANAVDDAAAGQIWMRLMQADTQAGGPLDPAEHRDLQRRTRDRFLFELEAPLALLRDAAAAGTAHPAYTQGAETLDLRSMRWLANAGTLTSALAAEAGEPREAILVLLDLLQVAEDGLHQPRALDVLIGSTLVETTLQGSLLDPELSGHLHPAGLNALDIALARVDQALGRAHAFSPQDFVELVRGLQANGMGADHRGSLFDDSNLTQSLEYYAELEDWFQEHGGASLQALMALEGADAPFEPFDATSSGVIMQKALTTARAQVRLARVVIGYRLNDRIPLLPTPTTGRLIILDGDTLTEDDVETWRVTPEAARGRWLVRYPTHDGTPNAGYRTLFAK